MGIRPVEFEKQLHAWRIGQHVRNTISGIYWLPNGLEFLYLIFRRSRRRRGN